jgi:hypothetical protein
MQHRIYAHPFTRINEYWLFNNTTLNGFPSTPYKDEAVTHKSNHFHSNIMDLQSKWQQNAGIDIVTETAFNYPYPQTTEKILRPVLSKRIFILVGSPKTLSFLHSLGFKTFPTFINEEYDNVINPQLRISALLDEIKRICELDIKTIQIAVKDHSDILNHNFILLKSLEKKELNDIKHQLKKYELI